MSKQVKVNATRDYRIFHRSTDNRPTDLKKHKKLLASMERYGFLKSYPLVCRRDENGNLVVKDGQHRLQIAQSLDLEVYWIEEEVDFDIATINSTALIWKLRDYAEKYAQNGNKAYSDGLEFARNHDLPLGTAFALLAGTTNFSNVEEAFKDGSFTVKDRAWADLVAAVYVPMTRLSASIRSVRFIEACMAACRVAGFELKRMLQGAERCREKLVSYSTRDAYLTMLEDVYNFGRKQIVSLKNLALMAMRERNATTRGRKSA